MPKLKTPPTAPASKPASKPKKDPPVERAVKYKDYEVVILEGKDALTAAAAKKLLGWGEVDKGSEDYLFKDELGNKIRCTENLLNRPWNEGRCLSYIQSLLNKQWADSRNGPGKTQNGETVVIGRTGQILNGQKRLVALVRAEQRRTGDAQKHIWSELWTGPITMECTIVRGVSEDPETIRTIDEVQERSGTDVMYTNPAFAKVAPDERIGLCRMADHAVRLLWSRCGWDDPKGFNRYACNLTHAELMTFIERHPRLIKAVKHIHDEGKGKKKGEGFAGFISGGYAAGLLFLMGCSTTEGDDYRNSDPPSDKKLDWFNWEKAEEFWVMLGQPHTVEHKEVRHAIGLCADPETGAGAKLAERLGILIKAWNVFKEGHKMAVSSSDTEPSADLALRYATDEDGTKHLVEHLDLGGIDLGDGSDSEEEETEEPEAPKVDSKETKLEETKRKLLANRASRQQTTIPTVPIANGKYGKDGKPPAPELIKPKRQTRKMVEAEQTRKAAEADAAK